MATQTNTYPQRQEQTEEIFSHHHLPPYSENKGVTRAKKTTLSFKTETDIIDVDSDVVSTWTLHSSDANDDTNYLKEGSHVSPDQHPGLLVETPSVRSVVASLTQDLLDFRAHNEKKAQESEK